MPALGTIFVELSIDDKVFKQKLSEQLQSTEATAKGIERVWKVLGESNDAQYAASVKSFENAMTLIRNSAEKTSNDIIRAQSAMTAKINALNTEMANPQKAMWDSLGVRSQAAIEAQKAAVVSSYNTIKNSGIATAQDLINAEHAKNAKLKELNKEMLGDHEMNMASMTRAVLRFYAAWYVASTAATGIFAFFVAGIKAIDDMKVSSIAVAAQITSMQGTTGNVVENYKTNLKYAQALIPVLQQVDAASLANLSEIQKMNMAMTNQGVILDINKQKQIEAFTALTNAVAMFTTGQDKEKQASQEIRSLMSGQVKQGDMVAMQMDALVKKQGEYKGGLKELVEEGKKHGDTLERMLPYLSGIVAASGDLQMTWQAVSSSLETAWVIIQRGLFKDIYKSLTEQGNKAAQYLKDNAESIVKGLNDIKEGFKFATEAAALFLATIVAIEAFAIAKAAWVALTAAISAGTVAITLQCAALDVYAYITGGPSVFAVNTLSGAVKSLSGVMLAAFVGFEVGSWLNKFESVRKFGVAMVYGLIDAFEWLNKTIKIAGVYVEAFALIMKNPLDAKAIWDAGQTYIDAIKKMYEAEKKLRDANGAAQFRDASDTMQKIVKEREKILAPSVGSGNVSESYALLGLKSQAELDNQKKAVIAAYEDIKKSGTATAQDIVNAEKVKNEKIKAINDEMLGNTKKEANKATREQESATKAVVEATRKASYEIDSVGMSQYDKDIARIEAEAAKYQKAGVAEITVAKYVAAETALAKRKSFEVDAENVRKMYENMQKGKEEYEALLTDLAAATLNAHDKALAEISKTESEVYKKIEKLLDEAKISWEEAQKLFDLVGGKTKLAVSNENLSNTKAEADYYSQIEGYAQQAYEKKLQYITMERDAAIAAGKDIASANAKANQDQLAAYSAKIDAQQKWAKDAITGFGSILDAAKECYAEDSYEYNRLNDLKKAVLIAELAMNAAKNAQIIAQNLGLITSNASLAVSNATVAVTGAAIGVGPTGFATAAAMLALMAAVLGAAGIAFSGSSSSGESTSATTSYTGSSSVLGAADDINSTAIADSWNLLNDTYDMQYDKLTKIYNELKDLNSNIAGLMSSIFRTGGITGDFASLESYDVSTDSWMNTAGTAIDQWIGIASADPFITMSHQLTDIFTGGWLSDAISGLLGSIFGGDIESEIQASGIEIGDTIISSILNGASISAQQYAYIKTTEDGGWFGSDSESYSYQFAALDSDVTNMLTDVFDSLGSSLVELAKGLGAGVGDVYKYVFETAYLDLKDMDSEEMSAALETYFSDIADQAVEDLFGSIVSQYQQVDESLYETAVRLLTDKSVVEEIINMTGQTFPKLDTDAIALSESLISLAGDLETLTDYVSTYYDAFTTDMQQQIDLQTSLSEVLQTYGQTLPDTRDGFANMVAALDLTTDSGQEAYVALMSMAESADSYYSYIEDLASSTANLQIDLMNAQGNTAEALSYERRLELEAMDESLWPLQNLVWLTEDWNDAIADAIDTAKTAVDDQLSLSESMSSSYQNVVDSLQTAIDSISNTSVDELTDSFKSLYETALTGDLDALSALPDAATALLDASSTASKTAFDYYKDQGKTLIALAEAQSVANDQTTWYEEQTTILTSIQDALESESPDAVYLVEQVALLQQIASTIGNADNTAAMDTTSSAITSLSDTTAQGQAEIAAYSTSITVANAIAQKAAEAKTAKSTATQSAADIYLATYSDAAASGMDAWMYYITYGAAMGERYTMDSTMSSADKYLALYPDVAVSDMTAEEHYSLYGASEGRVWPKAYAYGGIASGSESGYTATLHGTELVVSPKSSYPATVTTDNESMMELLVAINGLRDDLKSTQQTKANARLVEMLDIIRRRGISVNSETPINVMVA